MTRNPEQLLVEAEIQMLVDRSKLTPEQKREAAKAYAERRKARGLEPSWKIYALKNPERFRKYQNDYRKNGKHREWKLAKYGLTQAAFSEMLANQKNCCAICRRPFVATFAEDKLLYPRIDHNHNTKRVRGLLCYWCNVAIGHFGENVEALQAAIAYIQAPEDLSLPLVRK